MVCQLQTIIASLESTINEEVLTQVDGLIHSHLVIIMNTTIRNSCKHIYIQPGEALFPDSDQFSAHKHWKAGYSHGTRLAMGLASKH